MLSRPGVVRHVGLGLQGRESMARSRHPGPSERALEMTHGDR